jgi:hypothetical protein
MSIAQAKILHGPQHVKVFDSLYSPKMPACQASVKPTAEKISFPELKNPVTPN